MKRRLLIIAIFLLLGAVVNVAVAWGCAVWGELALPPLGSYGYQELSPRDVALWNRRRPAGFLDSPTIGFHELSSFGLRLRSMAAPTQPKEFIEGIIERTERWKHLQPGEVEPPLAHLTEFERNMRRAEREIVEEEIRQAQTLQPGEPGTYNLRHLDAGWPFAAMQGGIWRRFDYFSSAGGAVTISESTGAAVLISINPLATRDPTRTEKRFLPLRPVFPGFAVNTLLYATILWLLIPGPFALRRFLRLRRGLCPKCAYPVGESSVCTECGRALA